MREIVISGIPYLGENHNTIEESIRQRAKDRKSLEYKTYLSLYDLVTESIDKNYIVIIDDYYLTYLNDIVLNYRDKECYIPYFEYSLHDDLSKQYKNDNKGHLIISEFGNLRVRYNFKIKEHRILSIDSSDKLELILYDIEEDSVFIASVDKWITENTFDIDKLYKLYIASTFVEDDMLLNKFRGGYHFITRQPKEFKNREYRIREQLGLSHYDPDNEVIQDYRDVRQYKKLDVIREIGLIDDLDLYKIRRLRFEIYLYCILRQGLNPSDPEFNREYTKLGYTRDYIKYGKGIVLIFKSYWLNEYNKPIIRKTWSRI